jgi:hypothetical protein
MRKDLHISGEDEKNPIYFSLELFAFVDTFTLWAIV